MFLDDEPRIMTQPRRARGLPSETRGRPTKKPGRAARFVCFARMFLRTKRSLARRLWISCGQFVINL